ncbi:hypothetical protein AYI68_g8073 [Smittium mucronatum]|uniref:Uncharacterized protein n=1 Tax=Smittium mucronatum TaxID=133383 RepID=A0A1R0GLY4_9FUNG|nr:hypothetical protein AYI68_g8073 [Smittium mucronatum]
MQSKPYSISSFQARNNNNSMDFDTILAPIQRKPQFSRSNSPSFTYHTLAWRASTAQHVLPQSREYNDE